MPQELGAAKWMANVSSPDSVAEKCPRLPHHPAVGYNSKIQNCQKNLSRSSRSYYSYSRPQPWERCYRWTRGCVVPVDGTASSAGVVEFAPGGLRGVIVRIFGFGACARVRLCFGLIVRLDVTARLNLIICLTVVVRLNGLRICVASSGLGINGQGHGGEQGQGGQEGRQAAAQGTVGGAVLRHLLPSFLFLSVALCMSVMLAGFCVPRRPNTSPADSTHYFTGLPVEIISPGDIMRNRCVFEQFFGVSCAAHFLFVTLIRISNNVITLLLQISISMGDLWALHLIFRHCVKVYNVEFGKFAQHIFASFFAYFFFSRLSSTFLSFLRFVQSICANKLRKSGLLHSQTAQNLDKK